MHVIIIHSKPISKTDVESDGSDKLLHAWIATKETGRHKDARCSSNTETGIRKKEKKKEKNKDRKRLDFFKTHTLAT